MLTNDFYGSNFVWWMGRVEQRVGDKLKTGSVRVRIFGLHSDDKVAVPTDSLPWAQIVLPTNGAKTASTPREGDYVFGFFQDGKNSQIPVILGVYNGIEGESYQEFVPENPPVLPEGIVFRKENEPINPRLSWEKMEGTMVDKMNKDLSAACDVSAYVKIVTGKAKIATSTVIEQIKQAFRAFLNVLGFTDKSGGVYRRYYQRVKEFLAWLKKTIKVIKEELLFWRNLIRDVIQRVTDLINFIKNLPEKFLKFVRDCISKIMSGLKGGLSDFTDFVKEELNIDDLNKFKDTISKGIASLSTISSTLVSQTEAAQANLPEVSEGLLKSIQNPSIENFTEATNTMVLINSELPSAEEIGEETSFDTVSGSLRGP